MDALRLLYILVSCVYDVSSMLYPCIRSPSLLGHFPMYVLFGICRRDSHIMCVLYVTIAVHEIELIVEHQLTYRNLRTCIWFLVTI